MSQDTAYPQDDPVVRQYERWLYPKPVSDLRDPSIAKYIASFRTLGNLTPFYWPAGRPREDLDILVAGCGTMAAACVAYLYPQCRVVGIDISQASLAHEERLREHHQLKNLSLRHCPLEAAGELGIKFHYISCHGVLHHLADPAAGIRALGRTLDAQGVIGLMVYAKYGRSAVYMFQELFRRVGLQQTPEDVAVVRQTLAALAPDHPLRGYLARATDLGWDAGIVDTFLHRRDRAYTVADCLSLVRDGNLSFQGWDRNYFYHPEGLFADAPLLRDRLLALEDEPLWEAVELAFGQMGMHWFYACRSDRDPATYRVPWDSPQLLQWVPLRASEAKMMQRIAPDGGRQWAIVHSSTPPVALSQGQAAIISQIDGRRTVAECVAAAGIAGDTQSIHAAARDALRLLWRVGFAAMTIRRATPAAAR